MRVTGLTGKDGHVLVAEYHGGPATERWWATIRKGEARYAALFPGEWTLILRDSIGPEKAIRLP